MKYYYPTTTLNFNNLLSSESVSPRAFYSSRGFGYSRWNSIPANGPDEILLLYRDAMGVVFFDGDRDDHLLLIEIDLPEVLPQVADGIYCLDRTIYLNPVSTRFIFSCEKDKLAAITLAQTRLETKMLRVYEGCFEVRDDLQGCYDPPQEFVARAVNQLAIQEDVRINRLKGLLYGYYIGALLSTTAEHLVLLNAYRELQNLLSAVVASPDKKLTTLQHGRFDELFRSIRRQHPLVQSLIALVGEKTAVPVFELFRRFGFRGVPDDRATVLAALQSDHAEEAVAEIERKLRAHLVQMRNDAHPLSPESAELILQERVRPGISERVLPKDEDRMLFKMWTEDVLQRAEFSGRISPEREDLADRLTMSAREVLADKWEDCAARSILNGLRRYVNGEPFTFPWENGLLSSVVAVVMKGDGWEELLRFMQGKGMTDYRLAFAFYGELNGFANLTRDFTDVLLERERSYVKSVYGEFHGQIHGEVLEWPEASIANEEVLVSDSRTGGAPEERKCQPLKVRVLEFFESPSFDYKAKKGQKENLRNALLNVFRELGDNPDAEVFLNALMKYVGWSRGNKPWKLLQNEFCPDYPAAGKSGQSAGTRKKKGNCPCLPGLGGSILSYTDWLPECRSLVKSGKAADIFSKDVEWFVKHWELHPEPQYVDSVRDKSNSAVLKRLIDFLEMQSHTTNPKQKDWKPAYYKEIPIHEIEAKLREIYGC